MAQSHADLNRFTSWMLYHGYVKGGFWKLEPQKRKPQDRADYKGEGQCPHYHFIFWGLNHDWGVTSKITDQWIKITGGDPRSVSRATRGFIIEDMKSKNGVIRYVSKYVAKQYVVDDGKPSSIGRTWGFFGEVPFVDPWTMTLTRNEASKMLRFLRRRTRLHKLVRAFYVDNPNHWGTNVFRLLYETEYIPQVRAGPRMDHAEYVGGPAYC